MTQPIPTPEQIKAARQALGRSQTAMAKLLKVNFVTYHRWEKGLATPQPRHRGALKKLVNLAEQRANL